MYSEYNIKYFSERMRNFTLGALLHTIKCSTYVLLAEAKTVITQSLCAYVNLHTRVCASVQVGAGGWRSIDFFDAWKELKRKYHQLKWWHASEAVSKVTWNASVPSALQQPEKQFTSGFLDVRVCAYYACVY